MIFVADTPSDTYLRSNYPLMNTGNCSRRPSNCLLNATSKKQEYDQIMEKKMTIPTDLLCHGFPNEFGTFLNYCRTLRFDDKPDYSYLCKLFRGLFIREGYQYDYVLVSICILSNYT